MSTPGEATKNENPVRLRNQSNQMRGAQTGPEERWDCSRAEHYMYT